MWIILLCVIKKKTIFLSEECGLAILCWCVPTKIAKKGHWIMSLKMQFDCDEFKNASCLRKLFFDYSIMWFLI